MKLWIVALCAIFIEWSTVSSGSIPTWFTPNQTDAQASTAVPSVHQMNDHQSAPGGSDECHCLAEWPAVVTCTDYVPLSHTEELERLEDQISELRSQLEEYNRTVINVLIDIEDVKTQLNATRETLVSVREGSVVMTVSELELLRLEIVTISLTLERLEETTTSVHIVRSLHEELDNLTRTLGELSVVRPGDVAALRKQIDELKTKLAECGAESTEGETSASGSSSLLPPNFFSSYDDDDDDGHSRPWEEIPSQDSCSGLLSVSEPYTLRGRTSVSGAWFRDPILNQSMAYFAPFHNRRSTYQVDRFANVSDFRRGTNYESRYILPDNLPTSGAGIVAYNGSLYYHAHNTNDIIRYDIVTQSVMARSTVRDALIDNQGSYSAARYTDIDFAVDEFGVWIIYVQSSDENAIALRLLHPGTLAVVQSWSVNQPKSRTGNCFVICARLYCINNHISHESKVSFVYDTPNEEFRTLDIPFDVHFGDLSSLKYNPHDQKLYGWDNSHPVLYDLSFDH